MQHVSNFKFSKHFTAQAVVNGQQANSRNYKGLVHGQDIIVFLYDPVYDILLRNKQQIPLSHKSRELNSGLVFLKSAFICIGFNDTTI